MRAIILLLAACHPLSAEMQLPPPGPQNLVLDGPTTVCRGEEVTYSVTDSNLADGDLVALGWSQNLGPGPCVFSALTNGGFCMDIAPPARPISTTTALGGTASFTFDVLNPSFDNVYLQAVQASGSTSASTVPVGVTIAGGPPATPDLAIRGITMASTLNNNANNFTANFSGTSSSGVAFDAATCSGLTTVAGILVEECGKTYTSRLSTCNNGSMSFYQDNGTGHAFSSDATVSLGLLVFSVSGSNIRVLAQNAFLGPFCNASSVGKTLETVYADAAQWDDGNGVIPSERLQHTITGFSGSDADCTLTVQTAPAATTSLVRLMVTQGDNKTMFGTIY